MIRATVTIVGSRPVIAQLLGEAIAAGEILSFQIGEQVDVEPDAEQIIASLRAQLAADNAIDRLAGELLDHPLVETITPTGGVL